MDETHAVMACLLLGLSPVSPQQLSAAEHYATAPPCLHALMPRCLQSLRTSLRTASCRIPMVSVGGLLSMLRDIT
jgi:hypothetical protein